jgi:hypothetical protein|tara:strand:+ start:35 stop:193 length:159 start_codon:yes stop_codon:yes gene_type:complete
VDRFSRTWFNDLTNQAFDSSVVGEIYSTNKGVVVVIVQVKIGRGKNERVYGD